ncbi:hypothetical protein EON80_02905 [bacterium]|nr:MAG: hypothetical protein EON80_02905 [bacterium]
MGKLSDTTHRVIEKMFTPEIRDEVTLLLQTECSIERLELSHRDELERIHLAVLSLSQGHRDGLPLIISGAQADWRDTLVAAGFANTVSAANYWAESLLADASLFPTDADPMAAKANWEGWVKCPNCGRLFALNNPSSWTGIRHRNCGHRLRIETG